MSGPFFDIRLEGRLAHFDLDYRLATDERFVGVFGPSGAGKTAVIESVAGWRRGITGCVRVGGRTLFDSSAGVDLPPRERGIGYVPQDILLFPHWDVMRNVTAGAGRGGRDAASSEHVARVLDFLELTPLRERPVVALSGGERRRVALARALCSEPDLLLLDEPLSSLDVPLKRRILGDLLRVREEFEVPMLLISHDATEVQVLCDLAQRIETGRVRAEGTPGAVLDGGRAGVHADHENVLRATVTDVSEHDARATVEGGYELYIPSWGLRRGERVILGLRADDVLLAVEEPRGLSARNVLEGRVVSVAQDADSVGVRVALGSASPDGVATLGVNVTQAALADLGLRAEQRVYVVLKSRSLTLITKLGDG